MVVAGQKFRWIAESGEFYTKGKEYAVQETGFPDGTFKMEDDKGGNHWWSENSMKGNFEHPAIRTITKREIVPGVYGRVEVTGTYQSDKVTLDWTGNGSITKAVSVVGLTAKELREAAHLLNQLAKVLEDGE